MLQAYAAGFDILQAQGTQHFAPELRFRFDLADIAEALALWQRGQLVAARPDRSALAGSPELDEFAGSVQDPGELSWTLQAAVGSATPADVLRASLYTRFRSR